MRSNMKQTDRSKILENFISENSRDYDYNLGGIALIRSGEISNSTKNIPISFPEDEYLAIQEYCEKTNVKKATLVKKAIKKFLEDANG